MTQKGEHAERLLAFSEQRSLLCCVAGRRPRIVAREGAAKKPGGEAHTGERSRGSGGAKDRRGRGRERGRARQSQGRGLAGSGRGGAEWRTEGEAARGSKKGGAAGYAQRPSQCTGEVRYTERVEVLFLFFANLSILRN